MSQDKRDIVDSNWDRIHKTHYAAPSSNTISSSYATTSSDGFDFTKLTASYYNPYVEGPRAELINAAIEDAKQVRKNALENAKEAMEEAFSNHPKLNTIKNKSKDEEAFETYTKQLGRHTSREAWDKKRKEDPAENLKTKMMNFPKHLSYEGSVVLCVMLSMKEVAYPHLSNLPSIDQSLIRSLIPKDIVNFDTFEVKFDEHKDFIITFSTPPYDKEFVLSMLNSVAHPRPEDLKGAGVVPVEKDGDKIEVGGKIVLNRKGIERLIGVDNKPKSDSEEESFPRRQPVAGRNAFEIRSDVMQMALDYATHSKSHLTPEEIVGVAKKFYAFVENKR